MVTSDPLPFLQEAAIGPSSDPVDYIPFPNNLYPQDPL
jgi:hypothetical protein